MGHLRYMIFQDLRSEGFVWDSCLRWRCHSTEGLLVSEWSTSTASLCRLSGWSTAWSWMGSLPRCFHLLGLRRSERSWLRWTEDSGIRCRSWETTGRRYLHSWYAVEVSRTSTWSRQAGYRVYPNPCESSEWMWPQLVVSSLGQLAWLSTTS